MYAGLRRGELRALRWSDLDLGGTIRVERALDAKGETIEPKSAAGRRTVPIAAVLRDLLIEWKLACPWSEGYEPWSQAGRGRKALGS
jgi:integrase